MLAASVVILCQRARARICRAAFVFMQYLGCGYSHCLLEKRGLDRRELRAQPGLPGKELLTFQQRIRSKQTGIGRGFGKYNVVIVPGDCNSPFIRSPLAWSWPGPADPPFFEILSASTSL